MDQLAAVWVFVSEGLTLVGQSVGGLLPRMKGITS